MEPVSAQPQTSSAPIVPSAASSVQPWPAWKKWLRIYSITYLVIITLIFAYVGLASTGSNLSSNSSSDISTQIAGGILAVLFIPVIAFVISVRSPKP